MPVPTHLLERAHQLINANQIQNAELVLDAVVRVDPQNVEAWMTYMRIHQNQNDLDWLKDRLLKTKELTETDKAQLVNYHNHLTQKINGKKENTLWVGPLNHLPEKEKEVNAIDVCFAFIRFVVDHVLTKDLIYLIYRH